MGNSGGNTYFYARKETPQAINHERRKDWLKRKGCPRNNKRRFTSPNKIVETEVDLNLSIVSDEEFDCYNKSEGKSVHTNIDDDLQLLPKENKLNPDQGIYDGKNTITEPSTSVRKSKRLPYAKQAEH